ncbi:hypothetical protein VaNZ11_012091 [Volvox africanus]|uniref:Uncharacterized protein n=1 Tax=Volvox africanus TaxID=51714 RepID=A0ABQ5SCZ5_9CHLO|nr:hypothetical protein VaNZ11_012091 [Volvox africanus]
MAVTGHPPGTLPPPSTQPSHAHSYGSSSELYGDPLAPNPGRHHTRHPGGYPGPYPPSPPTYDSPPSQAGGSLRPPVSAALLGVGEGEGGRANHMSIPTTVCVATPKIEMQPWARKAWRWLVDNTTGVARVDLRRPTPPLPEQYDGNLLFVRSRQSVVTQRDGGWNPDHHPRGRQRDAVPAYTESMYGKSYPGAPAAIISPPGHPLLMGARIKITRSFTIGGGKGGTGGDSTESGAEELPAVTAAGNDAVAAPRPHSSWRRGRGALRGSPLAMSFAEKPLLDLGVGINLDVDQQQIQPVARIKIKDLVSIKAAPLGLLKISRSIPLGPVALKVRYELPLAHVRHFWEPPARLMVRLDNAAGSGVHLTPGGLELDEQVLQFGRAVNLRASASVLFPRQLPLEEGEPPLRLQLHRLSLRSIW